MSRVVDFRGSAAGGVRRLGNLLRVKPRPTQGRKEHVMSRQLSERFLGRRL
jgi:hypothetical protein